MTDQVKDSNYTILPKNRLCTTLNPRSEVSLIVVRHFGITCCSWYHRVIHMPEKNSLYEYRDCLFFSPSFTLKIQNFPSANRRFVVEMLKISGWKKICETALYRILHAWTGHCSKRVFQIIFGGVPRSWGARRPRASNTGRTARSAAVRQTSLHHLSQ